MVDGKEFAVVSLGALKGIEDPQIGRHLTLEAEDGERIETKFSVIAGHGRFEKIDD